MRVTTTTIACILVPGTLLFGQPKTMTLDQARQIALERNLDVVQARNNVESAQAGALAARGNYLPTLSASAGWSRYQNDRPATSTIFLPDGTTIPGSSGFRVDNNFSTGLDLGYTVFDGFRREANLNSATSTAVAEEQQAVRTRQSAVFQTEQAYINVLRNEQLVKVSEENLKRDRRQLERITEANRVGSLSLADVYRQQSVVAADELDLITAQNNYDKAKADLASLIGLDPFEEYVFADPSLSTEITRADLDASAELYKNLTGLTQRAFVARPDFLGANENYQAAESGVSSARGGYMPTVSAFVGYSLSNEKFSNISDNKNTTWGVNIRWNLFDGFQREEALQSAVVRKRNAEVSLKQTERNIAVEVKKALLDLDAARKAYEASQKGLTSATEDRKIAEERYNLGAGTLLDLLTANAGLVNAQANQVNASYNFIIANRRVEYALGERTL